jgi:hypothetical protein
MQISRKFIWGVFFLASFLATEAAAQRLTATWQGQQLGEVLDRIASTLDMPLWLDRRVDPSQKVNAQFVDVPLREALRVLGARHDLGFTEVDGVLYVGPIKTARGLGTLVRRNRAALAEVPDAQRAVWLKTEAWSWPRLSEPRQLLAELMPTSDVKLLGGELVQHDLWPARELPPLALADRMLLLLAGFDLTCEFSPDGKTCRVAPLRYPLPVDGRDAPSRETGGKRRTAQPGDQKQYSLRLENQPVGRVLSQLAEQVRLELRWDEASLMARNLSRETLVTCDVEDVDLDSLLRAILEPAGFAFTRQGQRVEIHAPR